MKPNIITSIIVAVGLFALLIPFSFLVGWNFATLLLYWFVLVPTFTLNAPNYFFKEQTVVLGKLIGLILFYSIMVIMIYSHYLSGYFMVMMVSFVINLSLLSLIAWEEGRQKRTS